MPATVTNGGRLHDQAAQFATALEAREDAVALQMLASWSDSYWAIRKDLDDLLAQVEAARLAGTEVKPVWLTRQRRYKALLATAKREMVKYANASSDAITRQQRSALNAALKDAERLARRGVTDDLGSVAADLLDVNPATVDVAVGYLQDGSVLSEHLRQTLANNAPDILRQVLTQGLSRGKSQDWMVRAFTKALSTTHSRAVTILRTESLRAYRGATLAVFQANTHVLESWTWLCALDSRSCMACVAMHGTHHPMTETLDGHPRCRCVMVPRTKTWAEMGVPGIEETRPDIETGLDWFGRQAETTQRAMMGPAKFDAWKAGEFDLPALVARHDDPAWGTMRYEASLKSIRANRVPRTPEPPPAIPVEPDPPAPEVPATPTPKAHADPLPANSQLAWREDDYLRQVAREADDPARRALAQAELEYRDHLRSTFPPDMPASRYGPRELDRFRADIRGIDNDTLAAQIAGQKDPAARFLAQHEYDQRVADGRITVAAPTRSVLEDRLPRQQGWSPAEGPFSEQAYADMDAVNPNWRSGDRGWNVNCTNCTTTYELRRRGYDVTAAKRPGGIHARGRNYLDTPKAWGVSTVDVLGSQQTWLQMERRILREMPEGARGAVSITWKGGGGHIFNWEVHEGRLVFIESQAISTHARHYTLDELRRNAQNKVNGWWRHDHLPITDELADFIWSPPGHPWV